MKKEYDLSKLSSRPNPYFARLKKPVTISIGEYVIGYFKSMSSETGLLYNNLINLYLRRPLHRKVNISCSKK